MLKKQKLITLLFCISAALYAQYPQLVNSDISPFEAGKQTFDNGQYAAAIRHFEVYLSDEPITYHDRMIEAQYYIVYAKYLQQKVGVEADMIAFIKANEGSLLANAISYELGAYYFSEEKYKNAVKSFESCNENWLEKEQLDNFYYKFAYSYFETQKHKLAKPLFKSSIDLKEVNYFDALYYYSFLQYKDENYNVALSGFEKLYEAKQYSETSPYYMAQIYFMNEDYDKLITLAPQLLNQKNHSHDVELNRILGDAYYHLRQYDKAITYLEAHQAVAKKILRQDLYHLGVAYYMKKDYRLAAETLAQITAQNDPLSQSSYSYLGECFVRLDEKDRACLAFGTASKYEFDPIQREDAYYNYVKLSYETAISPFTGTISLLEGFLTEFPNSEYKSEIYDIMYKSYMTTTNYSDACISIKKLNKKDTRLSMASQRVHYYRGVELYNQGKYNEAVEFLNYSLAGTSLEKTVKALSLYWLGDAYYQLHAYDKAMAKYDDFITSPVAYLLPEFGMAHYNVGYCFFKINNYNAAINWFRKFDQLDKQSDADLMTDANNRVGDCYYLKRNFHSAIKYYSQAVERGGKGLDYAYYQKGFCQGLSNLYEPKIVTLNVLLHDYPESAYSDDALYEVAKTWALLERYDDAIAAYQQLPLSYPNSKYASKSLLNAGLTYYNDGNLAEATTTYKKVVNDYQGTEDARSAMLALKNISIDQNSVNEYIAYAKEMGGDQMQSSEEDSLTFLAAEKLYISQRFEEAIPAFANYAKQFPKGSYVLVSYFYLADAHMQLSQNAEAVKALEFIVTQPRNIYTEQSLAVLSATYFNEKQFAKALESYKKLLDNAEQKDNVISAKIGIMDCNYALAEAGATILAVDNLLVETLTPSLINKAHYYKAKSYLLLENQLAAKESFDILAQDVSNAYGAEAKYTLAEMYYDESDYVKSKTEVLDFINKGTTEQYWLAKGFILLADIFVVEKDYFQAKQYLLSISDNYTAEDDILSIVRIRLDNITLLEEQENQKGRDSMNVLFNSTNDSIN